MHQWPWFLHFFFFKFMCAHSMKVKKQHCKMMQTMIFVTHDGLLSRFLNILRLWSTLQKVNWIMSSYIMLFICQIVFKLSIIGLSKRYPLKVKSESDCVFGPTKWAFPNVRRLKIHNSTKKNLFIIKKIALLVCW